ncbi:MAG: hypothetical protein K9N62_05870 [Verrucomicrobia bacterium]|nr:hypothetical protein [Verrucomicrobiota bacterium]
MEFFNFLGQHWFDFLQTVGIVGGLFFTGLSFRDNFRARQVATLIELTGSHRDIWENLFTHTTLSRITKREVDLVREPITEHERLIVRLLILHLNAVFHASEISNVIRLEGIHVDVQQFFSAPIPSAIWAEFRDFQNRDFVRFVEQAVESHDPIANP